MPLGRSDSRLRERPTRRRIRTDVALTTSVRASETKMHRSFGRRRMLSEARQSAGRDQGGDNLPLALCVSEPECRTCQAVQRYSSPRACVSGAHAGRTDAASSVWRLRLDGCDGWCFACQFSIHSSPRFLSSSPSRFLAAEIAAAGFTVSPSYTSAALT
jgi:hypothetical protein